MYITTPKGNLIPVTSIKMVTPKSANSCIIKLNTGERTTIPKSAAEVLTALAHPDFNPIVNSIMQTLSEVTTSIDTANNKLNTRVQALENSIKSRMDSLGEVVNDARSSVKELNEVTRRTRKVAKDADTAVEIVHSLIRELNNAIQEV